MGFCDFFRNILSRICSRNLGNISVCDSVVCECNICGGLMRNRVYRECRTAGMDVTGRGSENPPPPSTYFRPTFETINEW